MTDRKSDTYRSARVFHDHATAYDAWFEGSPVYAIETAALTSLHGDPLTPALEVGVGPGRFAQKLNVTFGIDPAMAPLVLAAGRGIKCCQALGEHLPVKDGAIGTVYLLFTLCFVSDPRRILTECARVLADDGNLIIGMIPAKSAWGKDLAAKQMKGHPIYRYARFYTIEEVKDWLNGVKMRIVDYRSTLYQPPGGVTQEEAPRAVLDEQAGFVVISAEKDHG